jgi:beta-lactam-binding protein with PASTA domain
MMRKLLSASCLACAFLIAGCGGGGSGGGGGSTSITVPNVVGQTQAAATSAITGAGLTLGAVTTQTSATVVAGSVISESPSAGASVATSTAVALVVSSGAPITVPNVVGLSQGTAQTQLTAAGLTLGPVTMQPSNNIAAGIVISETPPAATAVTAGTSVALVVSTGPSVTVPNVVNQTQAAATALINAAGLGVGSVTMQGSTTVASGLVISQNPAAGTSTTVGMAVALVVSSGPPVANALPVLIDAGPSGVATANTLYTTVTVCSPGTQTCQTIDHVQVDTGSIGLSVIASVLSGPTLPAIKDPATNLALIECVQYADGYTWGSMVTADVTIGGRTVKGLPMHLMGDSAAGTAPASCVSGTEEDTVAQFGANGILGVGYWLQDCGTFCAQEAIAGGYYVCPAQQQCEPTTVTTSNQQQNPVALFTSDNNGIMIQLPVVSAPGAATVNGTLYFGVATQADNLPGNQVSFYQVNGSGYLITNYGGSALNQSFIDSGSNAYFFASSIAACSSQTANGFYCPTPASAQETATIAGIDGSPTSPTISFTVDNADTLFSSANGTLAAFPNLAGPNGSLMGVQGNSSFDWGLPFFFNRSVFVLFEQNSASGTSGPASAF